MRDLDDLLEQIAIDRDELERIGRACCERVKEQGDDSEAYKLADRWLILHDRIRRNERMAALGISA